MFVLSIGEFSRVTQLSIKALRLYHKKGILIPDEISIESGYRYYKSSAVEKAHIIKKLKDMGFSLSEIKEIVIELRDDKKMAPLVEDKLKEVQKKIQKYEDMKETLSIFLQRHEEKIPEHHFTITEEIIPDLQICGIRFKGKYSDVGRMLVSLFKKCGRFAAGKPFSLYYDGEYKEEGADIEVCMEVKNALSFEGLKCRYLKGGKADTLIHKGAYEEVGRSYQKLYEHCRKKNLEVKLPIREQYLKAPGFIFKGNPKKYLTKIMFFHE